MNIRYVAGVSWTRSGHHLLQRLLQRYFGEEFNYCDFYPTETPCCRTFPCTQPGISFSKNHDFDLSGKILPGVPYLVQYRALIPSAISDFELHIQGGGEDTKECFQWFATMRGIQWAAFMAKWVDAQVKSERLLVPYEDLVSDPHRMLGKVVSFCAPSVAPDKAMIADVVASESHQNVTKAGEAWKKNAGVKAFRRVEDFRFYDPQMFRALEDMAAQQRMPAKPQRSPLTSLFWKLARFSRSA